MKKSLIALAFGTLALGMAEFGMMSILSVVARALEISIPQAGHFISTYAIGVCIGALLLVFLSRGTSLKTLLILLMIIVCLGNLMAAFAPNYSSLLIARFISGLPHGGFFGIAGIVAKKLSDKQKQVEAMAIMVSGMTIANLLGIPLASYLTRFFSWHVLFGLIAVWALMTIVAIYKWVPTIPPLPISNFKSQFMFLKKPLPWLMLGTIMFANGGLFSWYSYINPIMEDVAGFQYSDMASIMMLAGAGMVVGNFISGWFSNFISPIRLTALMIGLMFFASVLMIFMASSPHIALVLMFIGVFGLFGVSGPEQDLIIDVSPGGEILGASSAQVAFNLGNALGTFFGGIPLLMGLSVEYSAITGIILTLLGLITIFYFSRLYHFFKAN